MRNDHGVGVGVENVDDGVGFEEGLDLAEHQRPLELVVRFVRARVLVDVLRQLLLRIRFSPRSKTVRSTFSSLQLQLPHCIDSGWTGLSC